MLPLPAIPAFTAPLAESATPPAAPLVADVSRILTGQYYFTVIVDSNSIQLVASVFFYCLCINISVSFYLAATPVATSARFYGQAPPPARAGK